jgi:hypothetical protein
MNQRRILRLLGRLLACQPYPILDLAKELSSPVHTLTSDGILDDDVIFLLLRAAIMTGGSLKVTLKSASDGVAGVHIQNPQLVFAGSWQVQDRAQSQGDPVPLQRIALVETAGSIQRSRESTAYFTSTPEHS